MEESEASFRGLNPCEGTDEARVLTIHAVAANIVSRSSFFTGENLVVVVAVTIPRCLSIHAVVVCYLEGRISIAVRPEEIPPPSRGTVSTAPGST